MADGEFQKKKKPNRLNSSDPRLPLAPSLPDPFFQRKEKAIIASSPQTHLVPLDLTGELSDFIMRDVREKYPHIKKHIKITLIEVHALICSFLSCTLFMFLKCFGNPKLLFYSGKRVVGTVYSKIKAIRNEPLE